MRKYRIARIISQIIFFVLFFYLVFATQYNYDPDKEAVSGWLKLFFDLNPLNLFGTSLAAGVLYSTLAIGFIILILTIFFGRFFCGWICPLGSVNHFFSSFKSERREHRAKALMQSNIYKPYQSLKYYLLAILIGMAIWGSLQTGVFDPISILGRSIAMVILPAATWFVKAFLGWLWLSDIPIISTVGEKLYQISAFLFLPAKQPQFNGVFWLALIFMIIVIANRIYTRFWCRALCPVGGFLGFLASFSIFGLKNNEEACDDCNKCLMYCQGGDNPHKELPHHRSECHMCLNCLADCPRDAISFGFFEDKTKYQAKPRATRRKVIFAGLAGLLAVPTLRSGMSGSYKTSPRLIRPPGSENEEEFLSRCIRCGQCMKICPTNAIHPTMLEAGWEGIFTPYLVPVIGYCEYNCVLCGQSCPTGAIDALTVERKNGTAGDKPIHIGTAFINRSKCLPWAFDTQCIVCEEWCPTSPKAIELKTEDVIKEDGTTVTLRQPYVNPQQCNGCGACEFACPVEGEKAIYTNSVGESRNPNNEMISRRPKKVKVS
ncbi:MAG: 4Fe-4S binding protein [candidate division Zixibacteria bacterium]|nr:4Fe-4S binding protein [candidate division Zixibacteria bacterium]